MDVTIDELSGHHLNSHFLETLASLAEVKLTVAEAMDVFRNRLRAGVRTYLALDGDRVVGTLTLLVEQKFIHGGGRVGHIEDVAVHPDYQKRGVGQALVRHATDEARRHDCYKVILNCRPRLRAFYQSCGYREHDVGMRIDLPSSAPED